MTNFLLIHGAWHGAWCWDALVCALERRGHHARAIDLPGGGADTMPASGVTLASCAQRIASALEAFDGKVWLAGHSLAGAAIAQASDLAPGRIEALVYVAASMPLDGQSHLDALGAARSLALDNMHVDEETGYAILPEQYRAMSFYNACTPEVTEAALSSLRPGQALGPAIEPVHLSPERSGTVPRFYVECLRDNAIPLSAQRRMQAAQPVTGAASLDTDHSPFLSAPEDLAAILDGFLRQLHGAA